MSELILERKALSDLIRRQKEIIQSLTKDELILKIVENTISLSDTTRFMITLKTRLNLDDPEVNQVLALCLLEDFSNDKIMVLRSALEKPYPKYEPTTGLTTLKFPPDFESHVKGKARKG